MLSYKPSTHREQKIIDNLNKPITAEQKNYNSDWTMTKEDKFWMAISSLGFTIVLIITVLISIP
ncbi:MAG: hypothetical protein PHT02_01180 [Tissierellia bacterium]|nr:hypothetical protein [Tissierellia bacterium]